MANGPFTIWIFVPDGDPEGVRLIDRMNWTGHGIVFPREKWPVTKQRPEFSRTGVYILSGYKDGADDLPTIYVGEGDVIRNRIESHFQNKDFWDRAIVFTATNNSLNKAHVKWLEYALVHRAMEANRSKLDNGTEPQPPLLVRQNALTPRHSSAKYCKFSHLSDSEHSRFRSRLSHRR